ncbi:putative tRNA N6-adenosine threonylcarbamoyltransferase [Thelohanellus kitauei]|uniref:N(6)-L-threonylcarbamoyladenine synthase n=1 Tax=Thelohanellus kitauei TaxID=669202 RepID=A0A0C2M210_THEKT|nr:putative tRNA N6-adenosine threonylcarbamoyltransferase [Thelohanellus kitauei]
MVIAIGFEGSANKLGIGVIDGDIILSNKRSTLITPPGQGFKPSQVEAHHRAKIIELLKSIHQMDAICFTKGPGMGAGLSTVAFFARMLSCMYKKPLVEVNHCVAHIEMGRFITGAQNPVILYVSGGNTQVIIYHKNRYRICGETLDIAVGNCIDRFARLINVQIVLIRYPMTLRPASTLNKPRILSSYLMVSRVWMYHFLGYYLISKYKVNNQDFVIKQIESGDLTPADVCFSLQETVFSMLVEITGVCNLTKERAMSNIGSNEVLVVGGVGYTMASERGAISYSADERFCIDNGLMIAKTGQIMFEHGLSSKIEKTRISQRYRTDAVDITWRN